ncbi:MAG: hypothetical protein KDJ31_10475 [Candidatus Competibacteraceae bacterium]|nr:hypothetical protein [Candidatus Competibacteraceae bacterium]MCB1820470.1 hypothetical protein [Candidatus Competibacteraceae bacterium]
MTKVRNFNFNQLKYAATLALLSCTFAATFTAFGRPPLQISVLLTQNTDAYQSFVDALQTQLRRTLGDQAQIQVQSGETPAEDAATLLVAVGWPAAQRVLRRDPSIPVIATFFSQYSITADLTRYEPQRLAPLTVLYLDQPVERYLRLIRAALPHATRVGVLYGPSSRKQSTALRAAAQRDRFTLKEVELTAQDNVVRVLDSLLAMIDVLLVLPDPEVSSDKNVYPLLLSSYRRGIPVIGFSKAYVHAGALAAVYSTPQQLGQQTATMIIHFLQSNPRHFPPPQPPVDFQISVNPSVARSLGLTMPDEQALYQHVRAFEAVSR